MSRVHIRNPGSRQTISATGLARNTRHMLDRVATGSKGVAIERNHALMTRIGPADRTNAATQALAGLPLPMVGCRAGLDVVGRQPARFRRRGAQPMGMAFDSCSWAALVPGQVDRSQLASAAKDALVFTSLISLGERAG